MAHKKGQGSSRNGRDSKPQMRGIKKYAGEKVNAGSIIVRQLGTKVHPGHNVRLGRDYTVFAAIPGIVRYQSGHKVKVHVDPFPPAPEGTDSN